jgi:murein DD-endopeptidase MepM/ murein hydrolase activator NlpD
VLRRTLPKLAVLSFLVAAPAAAAASDGAADAPAYGGAGYGELEQPQQSIDVNPAEAEQKPKPDPKQPKDAPTASGSGGHPLLTTFGVGSSRMYLFGRAARVSFQINDGAATVSVRLAVISATTGARIRTIDLGEQTTGVPHIYRFRGREGGSLPAGRYRLRVKARDGAGNGLVRNAGTSAVDEIGVFPYRFPLKGSFTYGGGDSGFGAPRSGHTHQGQDIPAPEGTQVRAARGGVVTTVAYQASGAGNYIVIDGAGEKHDYVYMHLQTGSNRVQQGDRVKTGEWIANVGNTGASFGAHLHFEIWQGPWFAGGEPIDPLPFLRSWDRWS